MIHPNLSPDSAWSKAHHHSTTGRAGCDHTSRPGLATLPFKATAISRIEFDDAEAQYFRRSHSATEERTVPGAPPHQVLSAKVSSSHDGLVFSSPYLSTPGRSGKRIQ